MGTEQTMHEKYRLKSRAKKTEEEKANIKKTALKRAIAEVKRYEAMKAKQEVENTTGLAKGKLHKKKKSMKKETTTVHGHIARGKRKLSEAILGKGSMHRKSGTGSSYISNTEYEDALEEASKKE
jgi:hypothetical protein